MEKKSMEKQQGGDAESDRAGALRRIGGFVRRALSRVVPSNVARSRDDERPGYYLMSYDWVGTRQKGDLSIDELYEVIDGLDDGLEAAYDSFAVDPGQPQQ